MKNEITDHNLQLDGTSSIVRNNYVAFTKSCEPCKIYFCVSPLLRMTDLVDFCPE